jgi:chaperone required for assembly of F1-ATPase
MQERWAIRRGRDMSRRSASGRQALDTAAEFWLRLRPRYCSDRHVASLAVAAHVGRMRDLLDGVFAIEPLDPTEAARRSMRPRLRRRSYERASVDSGAGELRVALDGRAVKTPAGRPLAAPTRALAEALAAEWAAQSEVIDPSKMPLTRLVNTIIDGVAHSCSEVAAEVEKYLACDLVLYRAERPQGLIERQAAAWDLVLAWAHASLGARFEPVQGMVHVAQSPQTLCAACAAIPRHPWRLGALHMMTTLTGSALIALAFAGGAISLAQAWSAAHVDEDWNMEHWGRDELALERRACRFVDMQAAARVLQALA